MSHRSTTLLAAFTASLLSASVYAGPVLLTGHDPDFHAQGTSTEATNTRLFLDSILDFVTGGTYDGGAQKFLWVESRIAPPSGHRTGELGLTALGLTLGTNYDRANASELSTVTFSSYTAIVVASSFGGLLGRAELDALITRSADIASFVNAGGGLAAFAECSATSGCGANLLGGSTAPSLFGFVPVTGIVPVGVAGPFTVTAAGAAAPYNLQDAWVNSPTHNAFSEVGGLTVLDTDTNGNAVTIAGNVTISGGGFSPVPEPPVVLLLGAAMLLLGTWGWLQRGTATRPAHEHR